MDEQEETSSRASSSRYGKVYKFLRMRKDLRCNHRRPSRETGDCLFQLRVTFVGYDVCIRKHQAKILGT